jgi:hypothetical protein
MKIITSSVCAAVDIELESAYLMQWVVIRLQ